jgi:hypothetical protein
MQTVEMPMRRHAALDDRRRMPRESIRARGLVSIRVPGEESDGQMVEVADLTLQGVGFNSPVAFNEGDLHHILVMAGPLRLSSRLKVVSSRACDDGTFEIGAEFC